MNTAHFTFVLHLADNALILGQRNAEWCGHGPVLEQDIAITNIPLDLIGQARNLFQYAASIYKELEPSQKEAVDSLLPRLWKGFGRHLEEDDLAFLRDERQYLNVLLAELPKGDWAQTVLRQFFFSAFQLDQYRLLKEQGPEALSGIAEKSIKEVAYHLRWSSEWVVRLGGGTGESRARIMKALEEVWPYTGELFLPADYEPYTSATSLQEAWKARVENVFAQANLEIPSSTWAQQGGKAGRHTEHLGYLLTEMQYLQRTYPNATW